jgi:hypothetical protein
MEQERWAGVTDVRPRVPAVQVTGTDLCLTVTVRGDMKLDDAAVTVTRGAHVLVPDTRSVAGICVAAVRNTKVEAVPEHGTMG